MATVETGGPTPAKVAKLATQQVRLPRKTLIGVFGSATSPGALVRNDAGQIKRVTVGDEVDGTRVAAIGEDSLILSGRGRDEVLRLPKT